MKARFLISSAILAVLLACLDQYLKTHVSVTIRNSGSVLGLALPNALVIVLHIVVITVGAIVLMVKSRSLSVQLVGIVMLVVSLSNLADRMFWGAVIDYICVAGIWFNVADSVITAGVLLLIYKLMRTQ